MPVFYRLHQDQSVGTKRSGKWYARMVPTSTINTKQLAAIMQRNCTVKVSDIRAVIEEMIETMRDQLQDSKRVKLDGFGSFKIGINCKGARSAKEGLHRHRQHQGRTHRVHSRALYRLCRKPLQDIP